MTLLHGIDHLFKHVLNVNNKPFSDFKNGHTLYAFDLTTGLTNSNSFNLIQEGNISLDIRSKLSAKVRLTIVCYLEYDAVIEIGKDHNIYCEQ